MKKRLISTFILTIIAFVLIACMCTSCSGNTKSGKAILKDVKESDSYFDDFGLTVTSYEIEKRQTNEESRSDYVWFSVTAKNDTFEYTASYELSYILNGLSWSLDYVVKTDYDGTPLVASDYSKNDLISVLSFLGYNNVSDLSINNHITNFETETDKYYLSFTDSGTFLTENIEMTLSFHFNIPNMWVGSYDFYITSADRHLSYDGLYTSGIGNTLVYYIGDTITDNMTVTEYGEYNWSSSSVLGEIHNVSDYTAKSFLQNLTRLSSSVEKSLNTYNYNVKVGGDYNSLSPFKYVMWDKYEGFILFIGNDDIAHTWYSAMDVNDNQGVVYLMIYELTPCD